MEIFALDPAKAQLTGFQSNSFQQKYSFHNFLQSIFELFSMDSFPLLTLGFFIIELNFRYRKIWSDYFRDSSILVYPNKVWTLVFTTTESHGFRRIFAHSNWLTIFGLILLFFLLQKINFMVLDFHVILFLEKANRIIFYTFNNNSTKHT